MVDEGEDICIHLNHRLLGSQTARRPLSFISVELETRHFGKVRQYWRYRCVFQVFSVFRTWTRTIPYLVIQYLLLCFRRRPPSFIRRIETLDARFGEHVQIAFYVARGFLSEYCTTT